MKKKAIEKIPPLKAEKTNDKKYYVAAADIVNVKGENVLLVDIFRNTKKRIGNLLIRLAFTQTEWGDYCPKDSYWKNSNIDNMGFIGNGRVPPAKGTISITQEQQDKIKAFFAMDKIDNWWSAVLEWQQNINYVKRIRADERKFEKLQERIDNMPAIPEDFYDWCDDTLFENDRYIFYKRKGRYAEFHCACCGESYKYAIKASDAFEGQFEHTVDVPRENTKGRCEKCDTEAWYKPIGRRDVIENKRHCYMIQPYMDNGAAVVRYFKIYKTSKAGEIPVYEDVEINRSFFVPGMRKVQKDYQVIDNFVGKRRWIPNNVPAIWSITVRDAMLYSGSIVKGTMLEYSAIQEYVKEYDLVNAVKYMECYWKAPQLEMIVKLGMSMLAKEMIEDPYHAERLINTAGKNIVDVLNIDKLKLKKMRKEKGAHDIYTILKVEHALGLNLKEDTEDELAMMCIPNGDLIHMLQYMSADQLINRVLKYSGVDRADKELCSGAASNIRAHARLYADYIVMRASLGYDMTNQIFLRPHDLMTEHNKMVMESNQKEADRRLEEVARRYPGICTICKELCEKYYYEDGEFCIRPARTPEEIVMEGRILHHCVGGDGYLKNHEQGTRIILFLRPAAEKDIPYVTVEVQGYQICQWYGAYDKKPDKAHIDKWLKDYQNKAKCGLLHQKEITKTA